MWYHLLKPDKSLQGLRVLITRAEEQADSFSALLTAQGATTIEKALLAVRPASDYSKLDQALNKLNQYQWIIFASQNAVKYTLRRMQALGLPAQTLSQCQLASIGPTTTHCLTEAGLAVAFQPPVYVAENLISEFPGQPNLSGQRILWPRTNIGRTLIADQLQKAGAQVDTVIAYESGLPDGKEQLAIELVTLLKDNKVDIITLASAQTARNLGILLELGLQIGLALAPESDLLREPNLSTNLSYGNNKENLALLQQEKAKLLASVKIAAIGPVTAAAAEQCLGRIDVVSEQHTLPGLIDALLASLKFEQNHI